MISVTSKVLMSERAQNLKGDPQKVKLMFIFLSMKKELLEEKLSRLQM
jgi:hypothetical protein